MRRYLCAIATILLWALTVPSARAQEPVRGSSESLPPELESLFRDGVKALRAGDPGRAQEVFTRVLRSGGNAAFVHNNLGIAFQEQNEHEKAIAEFAEAARINPHYEAPRVLMGASLLALGKTPEAIRELKLATSLDPDDPRARLELGKAYIGAGDPLKAIEQFRMLQRNAPENPEFEYQLGMAYLKLAMWCVARIRMQNPKSARVYQIMAENYRARGQLDRAKAALTMAARTDPSLPGVHLEIATIDLEQGDSESARKEIEKELAIVPESAAALTMKRTLEEAAH